MSRVPAPLRDALGVVLGLILGVIVIATVEEYGHTGRGSEDTTPFMVALFGYAIGTLVGATIAARIARHGRWAAVAVAVVLAALAVYNAAVLPHPWWFLPLAIVIFVGAGWVGARLTPADRWPGHRVR